MKLRHSCVRLFPLPQEGGPMRHGSPPPLGFYKGCYNNHYVRRCSVTKVYILIDCNGILGIDMGNKMGINMGNICVGINMGHIS